MRGFLHVIPLVALAWKTLTLKLSYGNGRDHLRALFFPLGGSGNL